MTFTCAHFDPAADGCLLLKADCVPGRPGCVLRGKNQFLVPVEERLREAEERRRLRLGFPPTERPPGAGPLENAAPSPPLRE